MNKDIEKYLSAHRAEFSAIESFDEEKLWAKIKPSPKHHRRRITLIGIAASVLMLMTAYFILDSSEKTIVNQKPNLVELEATKEYENLVNNKLAKFSKDSLSSMESQQLYDEILEFENIKDEILINSIQDSDKSRTLELLKKHYERKLRMIELLEREISKQKHESNASQI